MLVMNMVDLHKCARCLLPETQETITFDSEGVCNVCRQIEFKKEKIDWNAKRKELEKLVDEYRGKHGYDCIVPFSGGKDTTFTVYYLVKELNLKPLAVTFDHHFLRPQVLHDAKKTLGKLGVDQLIYRPSWQVTKHLMRESLIQKGDFCWHCHAGVFSYPMQVAVKYHIPLVVWGEPSAEYTGYYGYDEDEEVDERRFNRFVNLGITAEDMFYTLEGKVTMRDLEPFSYPDMEELKRIRCRSICLGTYVPWDPKENSKIMRKELGWQGNEVEGIPDEYWYEKVECMFTGIRDYLKYIKRGFGRTAHLMALDLRNERITVEKAREYIEKFDGKRPASLDKFLGLLEMTEEEFNEIAVRHIVAPNEFDPEKITKGEPLPDMEDWGEFE